MRVIRVVVADDDAAFRGAVVDVLDADPRFAVVDVRSTGEDIATVARESRADLVLIDVRMPGGGPEAARAIRTQPGAGSAQPLVVTLSAQSAAHTVASMVREGVSGYLVKGRIGSDLPDLLARCAAGEVVLAVPSGAEVLRDLTHPTPDQPSAS